MSLTDTQIWDLAKKMKIPLVYCDFKDKLKKERLKYNKFYIINLENEFDDDGRRNEGSHYTCFQINRHANGKIEGIYFDSYGAPPPEIVIKFSGLAHLPYNTKDIQSLMNNACGWYCLALGHFINSYENRTRHLYTDCADFTDLFEDLEKTTAHHKNEWVLKHFFRSSDKDDRDANPIEIFKDGDIGYSDKAVDSNTITSENSDLQIKYKK